MFLNCEKNVPWVMGDSYMGPKPQVRNPYSFSPYKWV